MTPNHCCRQGCFEEDERHTCFVQGCGADVDPNTESCPLCHWKKCANGHCGCSLPPEDRQQIDAFYALVCCPHCDAVDTLIDTFVWHCYLPKAGEQVVWVSKGVTVTWDPYRTPALGWTDLTMLEALADSAKVCLGKGNTAKATTQIHSILRILRNKIRRTKAQTPTTELVERCTYRETARTRCNRTPVTHDEQGRPRCSRHLGVPDVVQDRVFGEPPAGMLRIEPGGT
jgi:hypothetical protein